jgi:hypothetical protein
MSFFNGLSSKEHFNQQHSKITEARAEVKSKAEDLPAAGAPRFYQPRQDTSHVLEQPVRVPVSRDVEFLKVGELGNGSSRVSSNAFANGQNQNSGNFITDRPTTKINRAPGGGSSIVLG